MNLKSKLMVVELRLRDACVGPERKESASLRSRQQNKSARSDDGSSRSLSFGYGIHFSMGGRLAELQLRTLWEEVLQRFERVEVQGDPEFTFSSFVHGYTHLPVSVTRR